MKKTILIVDDEESIRWVLGNHLSKAGFATTFAANGSEAIEACSNDQISLIILDLNLPDINGLEVFNRLKSLNIEAPVIIITAQNTMKNAIEAMKLGAYDYIAKPFDLDEVSITATRAIESFVNSKKLRLLQSKINKTTESEIKDEIIGNSPAMLKIFKAIGRVAEKDFPVLITGESGTGKELVARAIHYNSIRKEEKLVAVNIAAIPKELMESELFGYEKGAFTGASSRKLGRFEEAHLGTLHLDEIGDMPIELQSKLLRILEDNHLYRLGGEAPIKVDTRLIASTNRDLEIEVENGNFRRDLYYRLNAITIQIPPLRHRKEDIPPLIEHFFNKYTSELGEEGRELSNDSLEIMMEYEWPGNIRELENTIKRLLVLSSDITIDKDVLLDIAPQLKKPSAKNEKSVNELLKSVIKYHFDNYDDTDDKGIYNTVIKDVEKPLIEEALNMTHGNKKKAAQLLGINRNTLSKKMDELGIILSDKSGNL